MRQALLVALLIVHSTVLAQEPPRVEVSVDVPVTSLDVVVTKGADRIAGLTRDDFEILEGNESRPITNFSEVRADAAVAPRRVVIAIDNMSLSMPNRKPYVAAAREFVERSLLPSDEVLVATWGVSPSVKQGWTRDRAAILRALDQVAAEAAVGRAEMQRRRVQQEIQGTLSADANPTPRGNSISFDALTAAVRNYASVSMQETSASISALSRLVRIFPRKPERKLLVIAGEGLPLRPGSEMWEYLESIRSDITAGGGGGSAALRRSAQTAAPLSEATEYDLAPAIRALADDARKQGVVIYAVRPGSSTKSSGAVETMAPTSNSSDFAQNAGTAGGYQLLAAQTGGLALIGAAPSFAFQQIAADLGQSYSIGFRSTAPAGQKPIVVKTKAGHHVRYSVLPGALSVEEQVEESVIAHHAAAPATNDLKLTLAADPAVQADGKRRVPLKVIIPVRSLTLPQEGKEAVGGFDVYLSSGDSKGSASEVTRQTHAIRWPFEAVAYLIDRSVTFAVDVVLESGRNQISVGVIDHKSKKTGFAVLSVP